MAVSKDETAALTVSSCPTPLSSHPNEPTPLPLFTLPSKISQHLQWGSFWEAQVACVFVDSSDHKWDPDPPSSDATQAQNMPFQCFSMEKHGESLLTFSLDQSHLLISFQESKQINVSLVGSSKSSLVGEIGLTQQQRTIPLMTPAPPALASGSCCPIRNTFSTVQTRWATENFRAAAGTAGMGHSNPWARAPGETWVPRIECLLLPKRTVDRECRSGDVGGCVAVTAITEHSTNLNFHTHTHPHKYIQPASLTTSWRAQWALRRAQPRVQVYPWKALQLATIPVGQGKTHTEHAVGSCLTFTHKWEEKKKVFFLNVTSRARTGFSGG